MKDRKGRELMVGDRVYVLPDESGIASGVGFVRKFKDRKARVDDGPADMGPDLPAAKPTAWHWSAWVTSKQVEKI